MTVEYNKSPIEVLGYRGWKQYSAFKAHLKLPYPYLRIVVKNYRDLSEVPVILPKLLNKIHEYWWSSMTDVVRSETLYKVHGVPPLYIRSEAVPTAAVTVGKYYQAVLAKPKRFAEAAKVLYLHSDFEASALLAASQIVKACLASGVPSAMVDFPTCMDEVKTWSESAVLRKLRVAQVACIYMVGKEYHSEFNQSHLETIVAQRSLEGKVTLLSSHLTPADFKKRYGVDVPGTALKFEDEKLTKTVNMLLKELED